MTPEEREEWLWDQRMIKLGRREGTLDTNMSLDDLTTEWFMAYQIVKQLCERNASINLVGDFIEGLDETSAGTQASSPDDTAL